jgi:peptidoglycan L-alanyl-D-glutamate endopeptidase CwlK
VNIPEIVRPIQAELRETIDPTLRVDGIPGPRTWTAIYRRFFDRMPPAPVIDPRSELNIRTLLPEVQQFARSLVLNAMNQWIKVVVTSGTRTYEEQNELFEQGRTKPGKIVTNARGGYSNHNFGIAFDVTIFEGMTPVWESPLYKVIGSMGKQLGLSWGGDWKSIVDEPHFELRPEWADGMEDKDMLAELRDRKKSGRSAYA